MTVDCQHDRRKSHEQIAHNLALRYAKEPGVVAVAAGGSFAANVDDQDSDLDLYVYSEAPLSAEVRTKIATERSSYVELDNRLWEPGDEWLEPSALHVDVMFRTTAWANEQLRAVLDEHQASLGYTTSFWYNFRHSRPLFDRADWFASLQQKAAQPYPDALARAIITKNFPVLQGSMSSYTHQIVLAIKRRDIVSVNHRLAAFLASYFDVLFALNQELVPGEKRLLRSASNLPCHPDAMAERIEALLAFTPHTLNAVPTLLAEIVAELELLLP